MKLRMVYLLSTLLLFIAQTNINITCFVGHYEPEVPECLR